LLLQPKPGIYVRNGPFSSFFLSKKSSALKFFHLQANLVLNCRSK
jgi:hypothetical protein